MILDVGKRMKPMRVLLTSTDNPYTTQLGGKHIHLLLLEQGLKGLNLKVTTLYYNPKSLKEFAKKSMLIPFPEKYRYKFKLKWMIDYLARRIPKNGFDIIHAHDVMSILAVSGMPQKKVLTLHGYFARENIEFIRSEKDRKTVYPLLLGMEKDAMKYADHVITVDERLKEYVMSQFKTPVERITVMHNAIDTSRFRPIPEGKQQEMKKTLGYTPDDYVILVPRRLVEKNGVIYAVKAMKKVGSENVRMIIAGDGPERKSIVKESKENRKIHLAGSIPHDKIDSYYRMADIILIPSITSHGIQEASSLAMLEGMACGKVVICSDIGGMHEIIQDTENGILVEEGNPAAIARAVETVMENQDLRVAIGKRARQYVLQNHSFVAHASKVAQIYDRVLREPNK